MKRQRREGMCVCVRESRERESIRQTKKRKGGRKRSSGRSSSSSPPGNGSSSTTALFGVRMSVFGVV